MRAAACALLVAIALGGCAGQQAGNGSATPDRTTVAAESGGGSPAASSGGSSGEVDDLCTVATAAEIGEIVGSEVSMVGPFSENGDEGCEWSGEATVIVARASAEAGTGLLEGQRDRSESANHPPLEIGDEGYLSNGAVVFRMGDDVYNVTVVTADGPPSDDDRAVELATLVAGRLGGS